MTNKEKIALEKRNFYIALRNNFKHTDDPYEDIASFAINEFIGEYIFNRLREEKVTIKDLL